MATYLIDSTYSTNDILKVKDNQLKGTSSIADPLDFSLPLTLDIEDKSSSSYNSSTTSSVSTAPSPIPSSSTSSISSLSTSPTKVKNIKSAGGDEFYQNLQNHSSLLRIVLQKEFPLKIVDGQWYRLDLQVVNELGLPLSEWRAKDAIMGLACELLELIQEDEDEQDHHHYQHQGNEKRKLQGINEKNENSYSLKWRALQFDAWEWDEQTQVPGFAGFEKCNKGGLEFKIEINCDDYLMENQTHHHQQKQKQLPRFFMRIIPTFESHQTIHALPLVVGPFNIMKNEDHHFSHQHLNHHHHHHSNHNNNRSIQYGNHNKSNHHHYNTNDNHKGDLWIMDLWYQEMFRAFKLNIQDRYFLVKEGWTLGTPGKTWDSALVLSDILVRRIVDHPDCFHQRHILDLSAGTGIVGLLVAFYYQHLYKQYHAKVTLTDLPEALHLIQHNQKLNDIKTNNEISIEPLQWGNMHDIKRIKGMKKPIDVIIASDVLYQPSNFKVLVDTLAALSTSGRTVIYLGYKRRGLDLSDENYFFELCYKHFHLQLIKSDDDFDDDDDNVFNNNNINNNNNSKKEKPTDQQLIKPNYWEKRYGGLNRDKDHVDAYGWLGPCVNDCKKTTSNVNYQETGVQIFRLVKRQL